MIKYILLYPSRKKLCLNCKRIHSGESPPSPSSFGFRLRQGVEPQRRRADWTGHPDGFRCSAAAVDKRSAASVPNNPPAENRSVAKKCSSEVVKEIGLGAIGGKLDSIPAGKIGVRGFLGTLPHRCSKLQYYRGKNKNNIEESLEHARNI